MRTPHFYPNFTLFRVMFTCLPTKFVFKKLPEQKNYQSTLLQFHQYHQDRNTKYTLGAQLHQCLSKHSVLFPRHAATGVSELILLFQ